MSPGITANAAPLIVKNLKINFLNYPVDFGKKIDGEYILGPNKTFRGLLAGVVFSVLTITLQVVLNKYTFLKNFELIDFEKTNFMAAGLLIGSGVLIGDLAKSFIKRRLKIPPGKSFIPWDQIDCSIGGLLFLRIVWPFSWQFFIFTVIMTFILHISVRHISYYLKFTETKW